jgi:hypothetical protein
MISAAKPMSANVTLSPCVGNDKNLPVPIWNQLQGSFLQDLETAGFPRESIDTV